MPTQGWDCCSGLAAGPPSLAPPPPVFPRLDVVGLGSDVETVAGLGCAAVCCLALLPPICLLGDCFGSSALWLELLVEGSLTDHRRWKGLPDSLSSVS